MRTDAPNPVVLGLPPAVRVGQVVAFDFEIYEKGPRMHIPDGKLACLSLHSPEWGETVYMLTDHHDVRRAMSRIARARLVAHNAPFDMRYLEQYGVQEVQDLDVWDTRIIEKVMFSGLYKSYGLDDIVRRRYDRWMDKSHGKGFATPGRPHEMTPEEIEYAANDVRFTSRLFVDQYQELESRGLVKYYTEIEQASMMAMLRMLPIPVDEDYWLELAEEKTRERDRLEDKLGFNPRSHDQVKQVLLDELGLRLPNTKEETLEEYTEYEIVRDILACRKASTAANTYGQAWLDQNVVEGETESGWDCFGPVTGRWSSEAPNMQNIPVRDDARYRLAFPARPRFKRVKVDADMQEPRCAAYICKDPFLLDQLRRKIKLHITVMRIMYNNPKMEKEGHQEEYDKAKITHLARWYGAGAAQIASQAGVSRSVAENWMLQIDAAIPGIKAHQRKQSSMVQRLGLVRTASNRAIYINPDAPNADQMASDYPIQGTAAEITKLALARITEMGDAAGFPLYVDLVVHDETTANVPNEDVVPYTKLMEQAWMSAADQVIHGIPFATETKIGRTWGG